MKIESSPWTWVKIGFFIWVGGAAASLLFNVIGAAISFFLMFVMRGGNPPI